MTQELKPDNCPFCGQYASVQTRSGRYAGYYVACHTEDCCGNPSDDGFSFVTERYAIEAWNRRTPKYADIAQRLAEALLKQAQASDVFLDHTAEVLAEYEALK